jgi:hypothetical protein
LLVVCLIACAPLSAQEDTGAPAPEQPPPQVVVSSMKDAYKTAYRNIQKALTAQHDNPLLAPQARMRWALFARDGTPVTAPVPITIAGTNGHVTVVPDSDGVFELPAAVPELGDDVELRIGVRRSDVRLVPFVDTGGDAASRRLGDLRLECEMGWRLEYDDIPFALKAAMKLMGSACRSKNFGMPIHVRHRLKSATVLRDGQPVALKLGWRAMTFFAPLHDDALGNDTPIALDYRRDDP